MFLFSAIFLFLFDLFLTVFVVSILYPYCRDHVSRRLTLQDLLSSLFVISPSLLHAATYTLITASSYHREKVIWKDYTMQPARDFIKSRSHDSTHFTLHLLEEFLRVLSSYIETREANSLEESTLYLSSWIHSRLSMQKNDILFWRHSNKLISFDYM